MMERLLTLSLLAGAVFASAGAAVTYIDDDFEGEALGDFSPTPNSTGFINSSNSVGNSDIVANLAGGPTGQHVEIRGNRDKHITQTEGMTLLADSIQSLDLDFSIRFNNTAETNDGRVLYSSSGDFSDAVTLAYYSPTAGADDLPNGLLTVNTWYDLSLSISPGDVGGVFTDTAKLRFANDGGGAFGDRVFLDDISITGVVPEPSFTLLSALSAALLLRRKRR